MSGPQTMTASLFRKMLPEFADSSVYLDEIIDVWLNLAIAQLDPARWGGLWQMGVSMFVAHQLAIGRQTQLQASRGGPPGFAIGMVASKAINGVSVSYNTSASLLKDGGDFNLTIYGIRFLSFARMVGTGGFQIVGADAASVSEADLLRGDVTPNLT